MAVLAERSGQFPFSLVQLKQAWNSSKGSLLGKERENKARSKDYKNKETDGTPGVKELAVGESGPYAAAVSLTASLHPQRFDCAPTCAGLTPPPRLVYSICASAPPARLGAAQGHLQLFRALPPRLAQCLAQCLASRSSTDICQVPKQASEQEREGGRRKAGFFLLKPDRLQGSTVSASRVCLELVTSILS